MYMRIVVGLDGSKFAEQVLPHVEALATEFGSVVTLLRATTVDRTLIQPTAHMMPATGPITHTIPMVEDARNAASAYLADVAQRLSNQTFRVEYEVVPGSAADVIAEGAERLHADLIAMTTHGEGGLGRLVFGSVADAVLRRTPCPVLLVRVSGS
ncbi:MAG: hypothetical protein AVDCRST_MAG26-4160 [uncultured Chloroflexia bacterium]|uniref:UspA domain-containing protein n=1 Tax=uncultured Chloroflexia bacterium TaxID=1672391 RepID=A0A6J4K0C9_9CHLR|nr:MAG: hypothetical protein AVDCRST_MAG26-4160 [uncultured Chloroflexia bacterium]